MKGLVTGMVLAALAGCAGMDWNADDNRVGYTGGMQTDTRTGMTHVDPVTGEEVAADTPWQMTYEGKTYYFADQESLEKFRESPADYAEGEADVR